MREQEAEVGGRSRRHARNFGFEIRDFKAQPLDLPPAFLAARVWPVLDFAVRESRAFGGANSFNMSSERGVGS